jgi:hypothetical protein
MLDGIFCTLHRGNLRLKATGTMDSRQLVMTGKALESIIHARARNFFWWPKELRRRFSVEDDERVRSDENKVGFSTVHPTIKTIAMQTSHLEKGSL